MIHVQITRGLISRVAAENDIEPTAAQELIQSVIGSLIMGGGLKTAAINEGLQGGHPMTTLQQQMAQALIDIHNALPQGTNELYHEWLNSDDDEDFSEWLERKFSDLLVELWEIQHRFAPGQLEEATR